MVFLAIDSDTDIKTSSIS